MHVSLVGANVSIIKVSGFKLFQFSLYCQKRSCSSIQSMDHRKPLCNNQRSFQCTRFQSATPVCKASHTRCTQTPDRQNSSQNVNIAPGDPHTTTTGINNRRFWSSFTSWMRIRTYCRRNEGHLVLLLHQWTSPVKKKVLCKYTGSTQLLKVRSRYRPLFSPRLVSPF